MNVNYIHAINQIFISKFASFVNSIKPRLASSIYPHKHNHSRHPHNSATPFVSLRTCRNRTIAVAGEDDRRSDGNIFDSVRSSITSPEFEVYQRSESEVTT
ncbi:hypothetical protein Hdeb2414_s0012g00390461 [Helianthus debilis subsp. tardiflorus]